MSNRATFFDQTCFPYVDGYPEDYSGLDEAMDKVLWSLYAGAPWDHGSDSDFYDQLREKALYLRKTTDRALVMPCGCNLFEWGTFLRRMDKFLMDLIAQPKEVERLLDQLMERHLATLEKVCEAVGDVVDILRFGDDLGMDGGPLMPPKLYRQMFKPRYKQLCDYVHKHSSMKTMLHTCGAVRCFIPDFIEVGYDIINPVQTSAKGMDPAELKKEFGKDMTFWGGGCNTREVLNQGTPQEVYDYCCRMIEIFLPGGGFVFNQEHNILPDVPGENLAAMYRAVRSFE
ncbi:MAG: uroporphyrinogen decarboxylase family protein [Emergencia sp.]